MSTPEVCRVIRQLERNPHAVPLIRARLPFENKAGSFRGITMFGLYDVWRDGRTKINCKAEQGAEPLPVALMPDEVVAELLDDLDATASYRGNIYVVTSYDTIIGWTRSLRSAEGGFYIPDIKYSRTTSKHQAVAKEALA